MKTPESRFVDDKGEFLPDHAAILMKDGIGEISRPSENHPRPARRSGVHEHGAEVDEGEHAPRHSRYVPRRMPARPHRRKATSYPAAIALASTWDPGLASRSLHRRLPPKPAPAACNSASHRCSISRAIRAGAAQKKPTAKIPTWCRALVSRRLPAFKAIGPGVDKSHVMATAKHFAVHGQPEGGTNVGPANYSERIIREYWLKPFEAAVKEAHVATVMPSYNEIDGIPSHSNKHLLLDILRHEWGFKGLITSDYFGPTELRTVHHIVATEDEAGRLAFESGVDVELPFNRRLWQPDRPSESGKSGGSRRGSLRIARPEAKFMAGLFDDPYVNADYAEKITNNAEHQQLALKAAHEPIILLKNQDNFLPLAKNKYKRIAVIGPNAAELHLGGYSNQPGRGVSVLQGIKTKVGSSAEVLYALGMQDHRVESRLGCRQSGGRRSGAQRQAHRGSRQSRRDSRPRNLGARRKRADLPRGLGRQPSRRSRQSRSARQPGRPREGRARNRQTHNRLLQHGRPNSINYIAEHVPAILDGWYLGQEGGTAVADVLFGDYNPAGRLPITVPRSIGQLPDYYYQKPSAKREYLGSTVLPLFPFGWGLSYSTFKYANVRATPDSIGPQGRTTVSVDVTNSGAVRGDEVVQLYIRDDVSSVTRPVKELRGFRRITLNPGETKSVEFTLGPEELSFLNRDMHRVVEPGTFTIMVGGNSVDLVVRP